MLGSSHHEHETEKHGVSGDPSHQVRPLGIQSIGLHYALYFIHHLSEDLELSGLNKLPLTGKYSWGKENYNHIHIKPKNTGTQGRRQSRDI